MNKHRLIAAASLIVAALLSIPSLTTSPMAVQIARNGEGIFFFGLMVIDLTEQRLRGKSAFGLWWVAITVLFFITEFGDTALPSSVTTFNETLLAVSILSPIARFWRRSRLGWVAGSALLIVVIGELLGPLDAAGSWIIDHAETWAFVILTVGLALVSRNRKTPTGRLRLPIWYAFIVLTPLMGAALNANGVDSVAAVGVVESTLVWIQRVTESFVAAIGLTVWFETLDGGSFSRRFGGPS